MHQQPQPCLHLKGHAQDVAPNEVAEGLAGIHAQGIHAQGIHPKALVAEVVIPKDASKNLPAAQEGIDPKTGQLIPLKNFQQSLKRIDEMVPKVEAGRKAFRLVIKLTELYDELHQNQVLVSMVVVCPAAKDQQESEVNEVRLK